MLEVGLNLSGSDGCAWLCSMQCQKTVPASLIVDVDANQVLGR
ncbi:hypothetical protein [Amphritea sp.]